jgi:hypothetical protein
MKDGPFATLQAALARVHAESHSESLLDKALAQWQSLPKSTPDAALVGVARFGVSAAGQHLLRQRVDLIVTAFADELAQRQQAAPFWQLSFDYVVVSAIEAAEHGRAGLIAPTSPAYAARTLWRGILERRNPIPTLIKDINRMHEARIAGHFRNLVAAFATTSVRRGLVADQSAATMLRRYRIGRSRDVGQLRAWRASHPFGSTPVSELLAPDRLTATRESLESRHPAAVPRLKLFGTDELKLFNAGRSYLASPVAEFG